MFANTPAGYHTITPYLIVDGAAALIGFISQVFNAQEMHRSQRPDGSIGHSEFRIGDSVLMLSNATADYPAMPAMLFLYVDDVDALYARALDAGATSLRAPVDEHGDRMSGVLDPCGNQWWLATRSAAQA